MRLSIDVEGFLSVDVEGFLSMDVEGFLCFEGKLAILYVLLQLTLGTWHRRQRTDAAIVHDV
jgi:hypothetical protein